MQSNSTTSPQVASRPGGDLKPDRPSRVYGCWLGKSIGGTLGLPAEGKMERLHFTFYDPVPTMAPPNDDLELQLVWLHLVEQAGSSLTRGDFAQAWLRHIHYMWDEYGRCRWNLRRGVPVECNGTFENPFGDSMGSPIRSEIWACLFPGDPGSAAHYAALDASLDHGIEGIAGEVFFSVLQSLVANGTAVEQAIEDALAYLPGNSQCARAIERARSGFKSNQEPWSCHQDLLAQHGSENFTYAPLNVALTVWALLYGGGDFEKSILLAVNGGYDTDCTAATVGATIGLSVGREGIPARWIAPIGEGIFVGPGIRDIMAPRTLDELTRRTLDLEGRLRPVSWNPGLWTTKPPVVDGARLPGTILLRPFNDGDPVGWANGELPDAVKQAGGAEWIWETISGESHELICLAREGARLWIDGQLIIDCPAGLSYVPATHRCAREARVKLTPVNGRHQMRLELNSTASDQQACVLLTYPDWHLCPWTTEELPHRAVLPAS